jgi:hypothetical protein
MLAGRPHEAVGNGSPRWMTVAPRERGTEPGLQADSPTFHGSHPLLTRTGLRGATEPASTFSHASRTAWPRAFKPRLSMARFGFHNRGADMGDSWYMRYEAFSLAPKLCDAGEVDKQLLPREIGFYAANSLAPGRTAGKSRCRPGRRSRRPKGGMSQAEPLVRPTGAYPTLPSEVSHRSPKLGP